MRINDIAESGDCLASRIGMERMRDLVAAHFGIQLKHLGIAVWAEAIVQPRLWGSKDEATYESEPNRLWIRVAA